jgi:hypothetical protein
MVLRMEYLVMVEKQKGQEWPLQKTRQKAQNWRASKEAAEDLTGNP